MKLVKINERLQVWKSEKPSRDHSYIADIDLADHCPNFWSKCFSVQHNPDWSYRQKHFVKSILEFYDDWSYITWKQYDSVMKLWVDSRQTKKELKLANTRYLAETMSNLKLWGRKSFQNFTDETFNKHVLPYMNEDDLIGRYLPTEESMDRMWTNLSQNDILTIFN